MARASDWLRLARVPLAPTAALDALACALLARGPGFVRDGAPATSLIDFLALGASSVLVYVAGMAGNDWADRRIDRNLHPERPIPAGRISARAAGIFVLIAAALALALGGGPAGSRLTVAVALGCAAAYDLGAKRSGALGPLAMFGVRATNAAIGVVPLLLAGHVGPLALVAPVLVGLYSAGVTVLSLAEEPGRRGVARLRVARAAALVAFAGAIALSIVGAQGATFGAIFGVTIVVSIVARRTPRTSAFVKADGPQIRSERTRVPLPVGAQVLELLLGLFWLEAILANGARPGDDAVFTLAVFAIAFAGIVSSQLAIRALRRRA